MIKKFENLNELKNAIDASIKGKGRLITLEELLVIMPERKVKRDIRGILKGLIDKKATDLMREERESWR